MLYIAIVAGLITSVAGYCTVRRKWQQYRYRKIYGNIGARYISPE